MAIDYFPFDATQSFRAFIVEQCLGGRDESIVSEHWDVATGVFYCAIADESGEVRAHLFQDRGDATLGGIAMRGVTKSTEDELPAFIHCPRELIEKLSAPRSSEAHTWRKCVLAWRTRLEVLLGATMEARPGDRIRISPPPTGGRIFEAVVTKGNAIVAAPGSEWPDLYGVMDLLADGYAVAVQRN